MELPIYQHNIIQAMRLGSKIWMDDFEKKTYHININNSTKQINEPTISTLIWRGLIRFDGQNLILTTLGQNAQIYHNTNI
jgi:hypothetical protein